MERNALDESAKRVMEYKLERKALDKKNKKMLEGQAKRKTKRWKKTKNAGVWSATRFFLK